MIFSRNVRKYENLSTYLRNLERLLIRMLRGRRFCLTFSIFFWCLLEFACRFWRYGTCGWGWEKENKLYWYGWIWIWMIERLRFLSWSQWMVWVMWRAESNTVKSHLVEPFMNSYHHKSIGIWNLNARNRFSPKNERTDKPHILSSLELVVPIYFKIHTNIAL